MSCWPAMRMALLLRWGRASRKACEQMTAAPAPSDVGLHWSFVRGGWIMVLLRISSRVYFCWNWAYGFRWECSWEMRAISAKSSAFAPYLENALVDAPVSRDGVLTCPYTPVPHCQSTGHFWDCRASHVCPASLPCLGP